MNYKRYLIVIIIIINIIIMKTTSIIISVFLSSVQCLDPPNEKETAKLPPCGACTNLVTSFEAGLERTKRGKLEGGDAAWEEKSKQKYATSEVQ